MPDDLDRQLEAFGRTLREATGEPIERDIMGTPTSGAHRATRRWALLGAAACVVVAVVGIGLAAGDRASAPSAPSTVSTPFDGATLPAVPAPDVPIDSLRLDPLWTLTRYSRSPFAVIDETSCGEMRELTALSGHEVVVEEYRGPTDATWMTVTHVRYPDRATAEERLAPVTDLRDCADTNLDGYEQLDDRLITDVGIAVMGHRQRGSAQVAFVDSEGGAVLVRVGNDDSDATLELIAERSSAWFRGELVPPPPTTTRTGLDDLAALVGDDPVGLLAEGWTQVSYGLNPFESQSWPVCGPPTGVTAVGGAPTVDISYVSPSDEGVWVRFLRVDDAALRAGLGGAFVTESECPPSSQPESDVVVDADPDRGRWRRTGPDRAAVFVAPPDAGARPLVAIITGDGDRVDELADRAAEFLVGPTPGPDAGVVPADPLALERDGWELVQRTAEPFSMAADELACGSVLDAIEGVDQVHDVLTSPDGDRLDLDLQILDVGSIERGNALAEAVLAVGRCVGEAEGIGIETGALSSVRATWFRAGPDFALVTIVGEGSRSIVLEIEGAPFDDDLIGELAHRADDFLRGEPVAGSLAPTGSIGVTDGSALGEQQVEPDPGEVKLWVGNQSFDDDPVAITVEIDGFPVVDDSFAVEGQHNWFSFMVSGLEPGEHTITASSDTGASFEGSFTLPADEARWMVIDYWYDVDATEGRHFTFRESDEPIYFA